MYEMVYAILVGACAIIIISYSVFVLISFSKQKKELSKLSIEELNSELQKTNNKMRIKVIEKVIKEKQK